MVEREHSPESVVRVAALIHTRIVSGPGRQLAAIADALGKQRVDMLIIALQRRTQPMSLYVDHLRASGLRYEIVSEGGPLDLRLVARVHRVLRDFRPDLVQRK